MMREAMHMLRRLAPPIRPLSAKEATTDRAPLLLRDFGNLLAVAARGDISSGRPLSVDDEHRERFTDDDLARLGPGADTAEREGFASALLLMDGRGVLVDITARAITGLLGSDSFEHAIAIDGAVYVADANVDHGAIHFMPRAIANDMPPHIHQRMISLPLRSAS